MKRKITAGTTNFTLPVFVYDTTSTTGGGLAGLTHTTPGLILEYRRQGQSTWTQLGVGTGLVAGTLGSFVSGGVVADGAQAGAYELGLPNAAIATAAGVGFVLVRFRGAANMFCPLMEIELDRVEYQIPFFDMGALEVSPGVSLSNAVFEAQVNSTIAADALANRFNLNYSSASSTPALDIVAALSVANTQRIANTFAGGVALRLSSGSSAIVADWISSNNGDAIQSILGNHAVTAGYIIAGTGDVIEATNAGSVTVSATRATGAAGVRLSGTAGANVSANFGALITTGSPIVDTVAGTIDLTAGFIRAGATLSVTNATVTITGAIIEGNVAVSGGSLRLVDCTITGNLTQSGTGVVLLERSTTVRGTITGTVTRNEFGEAIANVKRDTALVPALL